MKLDEKKLRKLLYYAVDLGTSDKLSKDPKRETLEQIAAISFVKLGMSTQGKANMWQVINVALEDWNAVCVGDAGAATCKTPADAWNEIWRVNGSKNIPAIGEARP